VTDTETFAIPPPGEPRARWWRTSGKYALGLAPFVVVWVVLVGWLAALLSARADWSDESDDALVREWLEEARPFRKSLPEVIREYAGRSDDPTAAAVKRQELEEQLRALVEPTRVYESKLPGFPIIYRLEVAFPNETVAWDHPAPRPRQQNQTRVREIAPLRPVADRPDIEVRCVYQMHAFDKLRRREQDRRQIGLIAQGVLVVATLLAGLFVYRFLRREVSRENARIQAAAEREHKEKELLETKLAQQEAERAKQDLDRKLLEQRLAAAQLQTRADDAEKSALEMKSQLYASIGIMAGSYAHNIKNLLVRPNDLLHRAMEADGLHPDTQSMLGEVKSTLGTVTERLQQILRTVRRDTGKPELAPIDLAALARDTARTWGDMGRDKWKLRITAVAPDTPLVVSGDLSHLQQAIENLIFNARDATFEMRNHLREEARKSSAEARKQKLIDAAGWKGEVTVTVRADGADVIFEVRDNGIGMTDAVRRNCLTTHFSTKRDNAIYEGYSAGMGLGLSFVAVVFEHHHATLEIDSAPLQGATFRIRFPGVQGEPRV
jgi:signal transduction histidine kinase